MRLWGVHRGVAILLLAALLGGATGASPAAGFAHCGFYLHEGWHFNHPFAVRSWSRADYAMMYELLAHLGYDRVMNWPMLEAIPAPLTPADAEALRAFRGTIDDAHRAGLEFWLVQCANLTPPPSIGAKPWKDRNPYPVWKRVRLDDPAEAEAYFAHRRAMLAIVNTADAYVTIDGDPGGYAGAKPEDWLAVFRADREALDAVGAAPSRQRLVPWVWCGWGTERIWGRGLVPAVQASLDVLQEGLPEPWSLLPGRSHRDNWANGRINVELAAAAGLMPRSTILCYEAIEFEPSIPAAVLQFGQIRRMLREEMRFAATADGVMGNAQQPVMVLPNLFFFARAARDLSYLDTPDEQVLADFAGLLGGDEHILVPAWRCLELPLEKLPADLADRLRGARLTGAAAALIPGGADRYLEILAAQVASRRAFLAALDRPPASAEDAARRLVAATTAQLDWWRMHRYVNAGDAGTPFAWQFVPAQDRAFLAAWAKDHVPDQTAVRSLLETIAAEATGPDAEAPTHAMALLASKP
jgi:hypothetical protein